MKGSKSPSRPWSSELAPGHSRVGSRVAAKQVTWTSGAPGAMSPGMPGISHELVFHVRVGGGLGPARCRFVIPALPAWAGSLCVFACVCAAHGGEEVDMGVSAHQGGTVRARAVCARVGEVCMGCTQHLDTCDVWAYVSSGVNVHTGLCACTTRVCVMCCTAVHTRVRHMG